MDFSLDFEEQKKEIKKLKEANYSGGSSNIKYMKLSKPKTLLALLPYKDTATNKYKLIKSVSVHQYYDRLQNKYTVNITSPEMDKQTDLIKELGWKYKNKYQNSDNPKLKNLFKMFMPQTKHFINVINLDEEERKLGVQVLKMPNLMFDIVTDEIMDAESQDDIDSICHFNKGRVCKIQHNGEEGMSRKYEVVKFTSKTTNLSKYFSSEEIEKMIVDLDKVEGPRDEASVNDALNTLKRIAKKIEEKQLENVVDEEDIDKEFDDDDDDVIVEKEEKVTSEFDDDDDDEWDLD